MLFLYGTSSAHVGTTVVVATCQQCQVTGPHTISVYSRYVHLFWIPLLPFEKTGLIRCNHCLATHDTKALPPPLKPALNQAVREAGMPIWQWTGLGLIGLSVVYVLVLAAIGRVTNREEATGGQFSEFSIARRATPTGSGRSRFRTYSEHLTETRSDTAQAAPPNAERQALAADPQPGDTYVFNRANQKPILTAFFTIKSVSAESVEATWWVYRQDPATGKDELLSERAQSFNKTDLIRLEKAGTFRSISRK